MDWPTPQDYNEALQSPALSFCDSELMAGSPELTMLGLPKPISGNFASVYRLGCGSRDFAVRCFLRDVADRPARYEAISRFVLSDELPYTVDFEYLRRGILLHGNWYPILKMGWVDGQLFGGYVEKNRADAAALAALISTFTAMCENLRSAGVAQMSEQTKARIEIEIAKLEELPEPSESMRTSVFVAPEPGQPAKSTAAHEGAPPPHSDDGFTGQWECSSEDEGTHDLFGNPIRGAIAFWDAHLKGDEGVISGYAIERSAGERAEISGRYSGSEISFIKALHADNVEFKGWLSEDGGTMVGRWAARHATGTWTATRLLVGTPLRIGRKWKR